MIPASNEQLQQELEYTLLKPGLYYIVFLYEIHYIPHLCRHI